MNADVKITVLKRLLHQDLVERFGDGAWEPCERLSVRQEFVSRGANMPDGFCSWACTDIQKYVLTLARGGNLLGSKPGMTVVCCSDGYRPGRGRSPAPPWVVFGLERMP